MKRINSGISEVRERSVNNIYTKIKTKIISNEMITQKCVQLPGVILNWINQN